jgi:5-hydroxyisourate hydrolase
MSAITTHVLDTALGTPAVGVPVRLERVDASGSAEIARASTDASGRVYELGPALIEPGTYRLVFDTAAYARACEVRADGAAGTGSMGAAAAEGTFFPEVTVTFTVAADGGHYHVPLLLSPFGYSTYRGS